MRHARLAVLPTVLPAALSLLLAAMPVAAQTAALAAPTAAPASGSGEKAPVDRKVEHLATQDKSVTIDEVRVGGQTQSIEVEPSNDKLRPYQVQPDNADAGINDKSNTKGLTNRSWKLFDF